MGIEINTDRTLSEWASLITDRVVEINYADKAKIKSVLEHYMQEALYSYSRSTIRDLEVKRDNIKKEMQKPGVNQVQYHKDLIILNRRIKDLNLAHSKLDDNNTLKELVIYLKDTGNGELLNKFREEYNTKFPKPQK